MSHEFFHTRTTSVESVQADDEEQYVYLEAGQVQKKIEVTVTWNAAPHKKLLVTLHKTDTLSYLESKIGESMEKFELFEGLTDLRAVRLFNGRQFLPKKGQVEDAVKSGDNLWCDLVSRDQWIDVRLSLVNEKLTLMFEVRVSNQSLMQSFCEMLVEIANIYLQRIGSSRTFAVVDLTMEKCEASKLMFTRKSTRASSADEECTPLLPGDKQRIEDCFNFLSRSVHCYLYQRQDGEQSMASPRSCQLNGLQRLGEHPIRNLQVEVLQGQSLLANLQDAQVVEPVTKKPCCCGLW